MAQHIYRIIVIGAAIALGLTFTGPLAAHNCVEPQAQVRAPARALAPAGTPMVYADQDRDGRVTRSEAEGNLALARSFDRYDRNGNGELDRAEFARLEAGARIGNGLYESGAGGRNDLRLRPRHVVHPTP